VDIAGTEKNSLTPSQQEAVAARGNVLVMAGAGTGKTHTLVERCLDLICNDRVSLDEMLIVTFTEAAAAEVRERLREGLGKAAAKAPSDMHLPEQLALFDAAHIGTLHSFCFKLVREHFHALGLDPQLAVLDEAQSRLLADEILEEQFQSHYEYVPQVSKPAVSPISKSASRPNADSAGSNQFDVPSPEGFADNFQELITVYGNGRDDTIRALVLRLHHYVQTRADAESWLQRQIEGFSSAEPAQWRVWYLQAVQQWRDEWLAILKDLRAENIKAAECLEFLEQIETVNPGGGALSTVALAKVDARVEGAEAFKPMTRMFGPLFRKIAAADRTESYPYRKKTILRKPLERFFDDAEFLGSLVPDVPPRPAANTEDSQVEDEAEKPETPVKTASIPQNTTNAKPALATPPVRLRKSAAARKAEAELEFQLDFFVRPEVGKQAPGPGDQGTPSETRADPQIQEPALRSPGEGASRNRPPGALAKEGLPAVALAKEGPLIQNPTGPQLIKDDSPDPLREDWEWSRGHMKTLLLLAKEFSEKFAARKRADGVVDFHDLEQFSIQLLAGTSHVTDAVTPTAAEWRQKLRFTFVDEYQDINAAQDKIISALGADNRFLVGDVKQSIYRFRLADPAIFRNYAKSPGDWNARVLSLTENFRSREGLLDFVNSIFEPLMTEDMGGVPYDELAKLKFGAPATRAALAVSQNSGLRVEMLLREKKRSENADAAVGDDPLADLQESELEALALAARLRELKESGETVWDNGTMRPAKWSDFAVLLRSPGSKAEVYAKQFDRAGVPLLVERGGFYDSSEISDLLSVLQLADNPLQDVPCIAVLRSPLVGCSLDELAEIRLAASGHFWLALNRAATPGSGVTDDTRLKIEKFLRRFSGWRKLARQTSLSECLDAILTDTHYDDWLQSRPRGAHRYANVQRFLRLAEQFDDFQRQGLFRFLKFVEAQRKIEAEPDVAPLAEEDVVRLMSIHQSKGLEFPVVALPDLGKTFNEQDLRGDIILDEQFGLCPKVKPPSSGGRYPSLAYWLARKNQRRELRGEELRLLYVALTRARDKLILSGGVSIKKWDAWFADGAAPGPREILSANSCMDWFGMWFAIQGLNVTLEAGAHGESPLLRWRVVDDRLASPGVAVTSHRTIIPPLPQGEGRGEGGSDPRLTRLSSTELSKKLNWKYPFEAATRSKAKKSVTALRREMADDEAEQPYRQPIRRAPAVRISSRQRTTSRLNAADTGLAHHKFLQHFAFETTIDLKSFAAEANRLEEANYLSTDEVKALDLEALADFWNSEMGKRVRSNAAHVHRELAFTAGFAPGELDKIFGKEPGTDLNGEMIVVQGIADLAVLLDKEIWLVDFKTDEVTLKDMAEKVALYSPQLKLYARALEKIYSRPVTDCRLHFLAVRKTVAI
jgi:ATP-dependent helicase/nuclease subunit A